jgi:hypothetical protein
VEQSRINRDRTGFTASFAPANGGSIKNFALKILRRSSCDLSTGMAKTQCGILTLCLCALLAGCAASTQVSNTPRSSIEQQLLFSSLERALSAADIQKFKGKIVAVDFYGLTPDKDFAKEFLIAWLQAHDVEMATDPKKAQLELKVFAPVLAVDQGQAFVGTPSFTVPILGIVIPEVSLYKDVQHSGHAEVEIYAIDQDSGKFIDKSTPAVGETRYDDYTVLIVVHFTRSNMEDNAKTRKWGWQPGA